MTTLTCPRCRGMMQTYQRAGVSVDQCLNCRGIFLDHGELEHILNAEKQYAPAPYPPPPAPGYPQQHAQPQHGGHMPPPAPMPPPPPGGHGYYGHPKHGYYGHPRHGHGHGYYGHRRHRRRSLIQELFD